MRQWASGGLRACQWIDEFLMRISPLALACRTLGACPFIHCNRRSRSPNLLTTRFACLASSALAVTPHAFGTPSSTFPSQGLVALFCVYLISSPTIAGVGKIVNCPMNGKPEHEDVNSAFFASTPRHAQLSRCVRSHLTRTHTLCTLVGAGPPRYPILGSTIEFLQNQETLPDFLLKHVMPEANGNVYDGLMHDERCPPASALRRAPSPLPRARSASAVTRQPWIHLLVCLRTEICGHCAPCF